MLFRSTLKFKMAMTFTKVTLLCSVSWVCVVHGTWTKVEIIFIWDKTLLPWNKFVLPLNKVLIKLRMPRNLSISLNKNLDSKYICLKRPALLIIISVVCWPTLNIPHCNRKCDCFLQSFWNLILTSRPYSPNKPVVNASIERLSVSFLRVLSTSTF